MLLGQVVEKVSGQSLGAFIDENIVKPEGLSPHGLPDGSELPSPHAHGYVQRPDGTFADATDWDPSWGWGAGNMISTLDDMRVWTKDLAQGKLLSPAMKQERNSSCRQSGKERARSMGWRSKTRTAGSATTATFSAI